MFDIFAGIYGKRNAIWLEAAETLTHAKQRVREIAADKPGSYFVFDASVATAEGLLYQIHGDSLVDQRYPEIKEARKQWELASEELKQALALFRDLNETPASPDGNLELKSARLQPDDEPAVRSLLGKLAFETTFNILATKRVSCFGQ